MGIGVSAKQNVLCRVNGTGKASGLRGHTNPVANLCEDSGALFFPVRVATNRFMFQVIA